MYRQYGRPSYYVLELKSRLQKYVDGYTYPSCVFDNELIDLEHYLGNFRSRINQQVENPEGIDKDYSNDENENHKDAENDTQDDRLKMRKLCGFKKHHLNLRMKTEIVTTATTVIIVTVNLRQKNVNIVSG